MLSEKLETIFSFGHLNTRFKDFYDCLMLYTLLKRRTLILIGSRMLANNTFKNRNSEFNIQLICWN
nr:nucleotidyl transferase AbiEii/AbiGii toxin family protein [Mycoplasmopsis bovis]